MLKIRFQNREWLFVGDSLDGEGAIATEEAYCRGEVSYAHLGTDGVIRRFLKEIGDVEDIEVVGPFAEVLEPGEPTVGQQLDRLKNIVTHPSWEKP